MLINTIAWLFWHFIEWNKTKGGSKQHISCLKMECPQGLVPDFDAAWWYHRINTKDGFRGTEVRKESMFTKDIMTTNVITGSPDSSVAEIAKLLVDRRVNTAPVVDIGGKLVGIVSEGDLVHRSRGDHEVPRSWWLMLVGDPTTFRTNISKTMAQRPKK